MKEAVFVESSIRTLRDLLTEQKYIAGEACWVNLLVAALENYNNRVHGTTRMTHFEADHKPIDPHNNTDKPQQRKLQREDSRGAAKRNFDSKSYNAKWHRELSKTHKIDITSTIIYSLGNKNTEQGEGKHYEGDL